MKMIWSEMTYFMACLVNLVPVISPGDLCLILEEMSPVCVAVVSHLFLRPYEVTKGKIMFPLQA